jgi:predicted RNA binding protein YcfA (HicA-like mRNA interferase family)
MNERLPALTARDVIRALERAGFAVSRTSGSHCRLIHKVDSARKITVPVHSGDLKRGTLRAIIAQAGDCSGISAVPVIRKTLSERRGGNDKNADHHA